MLSYFKANKKEEKTKFELDADNIPQHIAIIMDGKGDGQKPKTYLELWDIKLELNY